MTISDRSVWPVINLSSSDKIKASHRYYVSPSRKPETCKYSSLVSTGRS